MLVFGAGSLGEMLTAWRRRDVLVPAEVKGRMHHGDLY